MAKKELPNKIWLDSRSVFLNKPNKNGLTEYTRTNFFIEKACGWLNNNLAKYSELTNEDEYGNKLKETVMNVFYGQAVKDFQAYMKGE